MNKTRKSGLVALAFALLCVARLAAEPSPGDDPLARFLYPPDKVLGHAQEIGLDEAQRKALRGELQKAQSHFLDVQLDMQPETEKLAQLLQEKPVDEARVMAQVDRVLALEREVKKTQLALLIRIKNLLSPAQQAKLGELLRAEAK
ncbi:MAG TPA: periplasmic heavy metal sensor [Thermoanaerobaculia bacterium]